jgi:hypothetical protein
LVIKPWGAMLVGSVAGSLSTFGFVFLTPVLDAHFGIHDTCGVNNLHGMPGILGGIAGALSAATAGEHSYGKAIGTFFLQLHTFGTCIFIDSISCRSYFPCPCTVRPGCCGCTGTGCWSRSYGCSAGRIPRSCYCAFSSTGHRWWADYGVDCTATILRAVRGTNTRYRCLIMSCC